MLRATFQYPGVIMDGFDLAFIEPFDFVETSSYLSYLYTKHYRKEKTIKFLSLQPGEKISH